MARYNPAGYNSAYTYRKSTLSQDNPWTTGGERDMDFRQRPFQNEKPISNNYNYPASSMHVRPNLRLDEHLPRNMHGVCPVQRPRPVQYMSKNLLVRRQEEYEDELVELNFLRRTEPAELNYLRNKKSNITRCDNPERDNFLREEYQDPRPVAYRLGSAESNNAPLCKFFTRTGKCRRFHSECKYIFVILLLQWKARCVYTTSYSYYIHFSLLLYRQVHLDMKNQTLIILTRILNQMIHNTFAISIEKLEIALLVKNVNSYT